MDQGRGSDQDFASIGAMSSSSSGKSEVNALTDRERFIAERLGVKPDDYLEKKQEMNK